VNSVGLEIGIVLEVGEQGKKNLRSHVGDLKLRHDRAKLFDRAAAAGGGAVAHEPCRLVVPLRVHEVDGILQ